MSNREHEIFTHISQICPMCRGRGKVARWPNIFDQPCPRCHGRGEVMA